MTAKKPNPRKDGDGKPWVLAAYTLHIDELFSIREHIEAADKFSNLEQKMRCSWLDRWRGLSLDCSGRGL